ncbi:pyridoxal-phosphate dependent enzyme [Rhodovulum marinum]|nr:pyridoxal-phosphate dependent enzyme [Rhodovulum marinum]
MCLSLADIMAAAARIRGVADAPPLVPSPFLSRLAGTDALLKRDIAQPIGAFKLRGALNAVAGPGDVPGVVPRAKVTGMRALRAEAWIVTVQDVTLGDLTVKETPYAP